MKREFESSQTGNSYKGISWRLVTTVSGDTVQVYRRNLSPDANYKYVNLGSSVTRPAKWAGLAATDVVTEWRSRRSSLRWDKAHYKAKGGKLIEEKRGVLGLLDEACFTVGNVDDKVQLRNVSSNQHQICRHT